MGAGIFSIVFGAISFFSIGFLAVLGFALAISSFMQTSKPLSEKELDDEELVLSHATNKKISIGAIALNTIALVWYLLNRFVL